MFQITKTYGSLPDQYIVDPSAEFQPGMVAQLKAFGNQSVCGVSDGKAPLGIIDDIKTTSFTTTAINETAQSIVPPYLIQTISGVPYLNADFQVLLQNPHIVESSFISRDLDVQLIAKNGVIIFPEGTQLNVDLSGSGTPNGVRTIIDYAYQIANTPGDDTTRGSGKVTVWVTRIKGQTDQFDTRVRYPISAPLFVNVEGKLTTTRIADYPAPAIVTGPPSGGSGFLEFLWL